MSHRYFPHTPEDIRSMLSVCGAANLDALYADVPAALRLKKPYALPDGLSEPEVRAYFEHAGAQNRPLICFAGCGAYDHYTPAVVEAIASRSEVSDRLHALSARDFAGYAPVYLRVSVDDGPAEQGST